MSDGSLVCLGDSASRYSEQFDAEGGLLRSQSRMTRRRLRRASIFARGYPSTVAISARVVFRATELSAFSVLGYTERFVWSGRIKRGWVAVKREEEMAVFYLPLRGLRPCCYCCVCFGCCAERNFTLPNWGEFVRGSGAEIIDIG